MLVCAGWIAGVVSWAKFVQRKTAKPARTDEDPYPSAEWSDDGFAWASVVAAVGITALVVGSELSIIVAALANPEYWALRQILK